MKRILIFKNDMLGDFLSLSGCINAIHENFKDSKITLICSKHNYKVAKNFYFINKFIVLNHKSFLKTIFQNFKDLMLLKYQYIFVFDGKNSSFRTSYFIKSQNRSALCFWKKKKILTFKFNLYRPTKLFLNIFFKNHIICDEDYTNTQIKYQELYFKLLENMQIKISSKRNCYILNKDYIPDYSNFFSNYIKNKYVLFHFDEKWDDYCENDFINALKIIKNLSLKSMVIITTGIKNFRFLERLQELFCSFDYIDRRIKKTNNLKPNKVLLIKYMPLDLLAHFISNSSKNITSHSGPIVHISPVFNVKVIDLIKKKKFNELGRWVPVISNYRRYSFEELENYINDI